MPDLKQELSHVLWICGGTDAGKTSVSQRIAQRHNLPLYTFDQNEPAHIDALLKNGSAYYRSFMDMDEEERWVLRSPDVMAEGTIGGWTERFALVIEDLLSMPRDSKVLAEGPGFFPEIVKPVISTSDQAVWLVPTPEFKWASMERRNKIERRQTMSDPERAVNNLYERDMLMVEHICQQAGQRDLPLIEVDGTIPLEEMSNIIEKHFELI